MFAEAPDIDRDEIRRALRSLWGIACRGLSYEPVGFGSHHYIARDDEGTRWFVTVDDLRAKSWIASDADDAFEGLDRSFRSALSLRRSGLDFVHAPKPDRDGRVLARIGESYSMAVFEYVVGRPSAWDEKLDDEQRRSLLAALGRLHGSSVSSFESPRRFKLEVPLRTQLLRSLDELHGPWAGGPFSEPARGMVAEVVEPLRKQLSKFDRLAEQVSAAGDEWVITHGEPHAGNTMWRDDSILLIDWDTVAIAPRERDLWMVDLDEVGFDAYVAAGGTADIRSSGIELFKLWWSLGEVAGIVDLLRSEHQDDANTRTSLAGLREYLPEAL